MRTIIVIALLVSLVACNVELEVKGTKDFVTGFFLSMRAGEMIPDAFDCVTDAQAVITSVKDVRAQLQNKTSIAGIVRAVEQLVKALEVAAPLCTAVTQEAKAYLVEIKEIVTAQTFLFTAIANLAKNRKVAIQDFKDYKEAKATQQYLSEGLYAGEIVRIIVWGLPQE